MSGTVRGQALPGGLLREFDEVAYLRFASVYQAFTSVEDFEKATTAHTAPATTLEKLMQPAHRRIKSAAALTGIAAAGASAAHSLPTAAVIVLVVAAFALLAALVVVVAWLYRWTHGDDRRVQRLNLTRRNVAMPSQVPSEHQSESSTNEATSLR